jgi:hypothetical protein
VCRRRTPTHQAPGPSDSRPAAAAGGRGGRPSPRSPRCRRAVARRGRGRATAGRRTGGLGESADGASGQLPRRSRRSEAAGPAQRPASSLDTSTWPPAEIRWPSIVGQRRVRHPGAARRGSHPCPVRPNGPAGSAERCREPRPDAAWYGRAPGGSSARSLPRPPAEPVCGRRGPASSTRGSAPRWGR